MREANLGDICEFKYGKGLPSRERVEGAFPVYGSNGCVGSHIEAITKAPAIVIGRKGSIGELHYSERPCWPIDTTYYIDITSSDADLRWLYHAMKSMRLNELNKATGVPGLNRNDAYQKRIVLPSKDEQRRIAAILDKADNIRRKRCEVLESVDSFLKGEFIARFGTPMNNTKRLSKAPIKEFGRVVTGNTPPRNDPNNYGDEIEWIKSDNINTPSHYLTKAEEYLSAIGKRVGRTAPAGSTLVTCIAGSPSVIGNAALADREVAFNQQINAVIPNGGTDPFFLYCQFLIAKTLIQANSTNSMKGMVSKGKFQEIEFLMPRYNDQVEFGRFFCRTMVMAARAQAGLRESDGLFNSLSHRAFRMDL